MLIFVYERKIDYSEEEEEKYFNFFELRERERYKRDDDQGQFGGFV